MNKKSLYLKSCVLILLIATAPTAPAADAVVTDIEPYVYPDNAPKATPHLQYMPDGQSYATVSDDGMRIDVYDVRTGKLIDNLVDLNRVREGSMAVIEGFALSPNASQVLLYNDSQKIYRRSFTACYWVYDSHSRILAPLSPDHQRTQIPVFSPDSRMVAFVADNNIYIRKLDYKTQVAVTDDGAPGKIINGATDWTYEEEFTLTSTLAWSPDNLTLCYVKFNEQAVPTYTLPIYQGTCDPKNQYQYYPGVFSYKYPVAGQPNSTVTLHAYDVETRANQTLTLPDRNIEYIPRIDFGPEASRLLVSTLNRDQNRYELYSVNPRTAIAKSLLVETSKAWVAPETYEDITFTPNGFVLMSDRSGFMQLYQYSYTGQLLRTLTQGDVDVTAYYGSDRLGNHYYQKATQTINRTIFKLNVKGIESAMTPMTGTANADFSPDCAYAVLTTSDVNTPPVTDLIDNNGKKLRTLVDNAAYAAEYRPRVLNTEFIKIPSDGYQLNAFIIRPRDFDPSRQYPVIMNQYSGPGSQSVLNSWRCNWMQYYADHGFIVVCVDPRGTGGRGTAFMHSVYCNLGDLETVDQINAAHYIATLPGVDAKRIGMCGWSYGGYEALMCATAKNSPFAATVAVAPVTDWRFYDTVYTERYMLTPEQNMEAYVKSAPLTRAPALQGRLLLMFGTSDDNVHPANSLQFVSQLQSKGILASMLVFPNMNHSINGCNARALVYGKMFDFFKHNL